MLLFEIRLFVGFMGSECLRQDARDDGVASLGKSADAVRSCVATYSSSPKCAPGEDAGGIIAAIPVPSIMDKVEAGSRTGIVGMPSGWR